MKNGLDDVIAAETRLSDVDGEKGRLIIRGVSLDALAGRTSFEQMAALLLDGLVDGPVDAETLRPALGAARIAAFAELSHAEGLADLPAYDGMRALMARLPDGEDLATIHRLLAAPAVFLPAVIRLRQGLAPIAPDASLGHSADMLRMLTGKTPDAKAAAALDAYLVTISDHGLNASTFAARVVASTQAGLCSSVLAAMSALKGPLHGGAPGPVLDMLDAIGSVDNAQAWLEAALDRGERLMGFGHRIYRVRDPRADALKAALRTLSEENAGASSSPTQPAGAISSDSRSSLALTVEELAVTLLKARKPDRPLDVNVEFYTALLLDRLGFPRDAFSGVFATGRVTGWIAHAREQALQGRLIRPKSLYVGPLPEAA